MSTTRDYMEIILTMTEAGSSQAMIAKTLTQKGFLTAHGKLWSKKTVCRALCLYKNAKYVSLANSTQAAGIEDIFPFQLPIGADFYCRLEPGPRRVWTAGRDSEPDFSQMRRGRPPKRRAGKQVGYR